jgi:hypothetical protein
VVAARGGDPDFVMCVTGLAGEQLAELQLMLGEGPCHDVLASAAPVLAADLGDEEFARRWPGFTPAARQLAVPAGEAFARLRAYAYAQDRRLADVAGDIVAGRLRLHRDQDPGGGP